MTILARMFVVRHGETDSNRNRIVQGQLDTPLNATGLAQAAMTAEALKSVSFDKAFTSDLQRASKTAERILQCHTDIELVQDSALRERVRVEFNFELLKSWSFIEQFMGEMQGKKGPVDMTGLSDLSSIETDDAFVQRCITWYNRVIVPNISVTKPDVSEGQCRNILVSSHGAFIATLFHIMISTNHVTCPAELKLRGLPTLGNASISIVEYRTVLRGKHREVEADILKYGDISHLCGLRVMEENVDVEIDQS
ncbi:phosphoglycerate mutase-like protein [Suillus subalutaceus]|uniref:phosphoglycerate mutase-like protein n=1 Tax=Suillus subalutaceus TaxID=48586 RepID=UPI001B880C74|nr:phosphoglycerate mutase-like protein [Suillus subalutaceus]KAG1849301.1 phosphoglycerate mutase-like protein [Suillus subalutaceus]